VPLVALLAPDPVVPALLVALVPLPVFAFVSTNAFALDPVELDEPAADPVVPTAPPI